MSRDFTVSTELRAVLEKYNVHDPYSLKGVVLDRYIYRIHGVNLQAGTKFKLPGKPTGNPCIYSLKSNINPKVNALYEKCEPHTYMSGNIKCLSLDFMVINAADINGRSPRPMLTEILAVINNNNITPSAIDPKDQKIFEYEQTIERQRNIINSHIDGSYIPEQPNDNAEESLGASVNTQETIIEPVIIDYTHRINMAKKYGFYVLYEFTDAISLNTILQFIPEDRHEQIITDYAETPDTADTMLMIAFIVPSFSPHIEILETITTHKIERRVIPKQLMYECIEDKRNNYTVSKPLLFERGESSSNGNGYIGLYGDEKIFVIFEKSKFIDLFVE